MRVKGWVWTAIGILLVAGASYIAFKALRQPELPENILYGNGHIEGTEVAVSAEVSGQVIESHLAEGKAVSADELLVRLDDADLQAKLAQAKAQTEALRQTQNRIGAELGTWRHHLDTAREDLARFRTLRKQGTITPKQLNEAEDRFREAQGHVHSLEAQQRETDARLDAAMQQNSLLQLQLDRTTIEAPVSGTLLSKTIEPGELAVPGRVVAVLVDLSRLELKVYIPERELGKVSLGNAARVRVDAFPERYFDATVSRIDQQAQFTPRDIHMPEERVRLVFGVVLALENPGNMLKPGMPADAWIRTDEAMAWPQRLVIPQ